MCSPDPCPPLGLKDVLHQLQWIPLATSCQPPSLPWLKSSVTQDNLDPQIQWLVSPWVGRLNLLTPNWDNSERALALEYFRWGWLRQSFRWGSMEAVLDSVSQDWAERKVGLLPSLPSPDSDPKSIPPKTPACTSASPGDQTCNNVPCLCTLGHCRDSRGRKKLLLLNVCYWKIKRQT